VSRHYLWTYTIAGTPRVSAERADRYFSNEGNCAGINHTHCQGGSGGGANDPRVDWSSDIWLWANKAKARRLAARLDAFFGEAGELSLPTYEDNA
jgi:hypothetical protein